MTTYIQTFEGALPERVRHEDWKPWINCADRGETVQLAAHRHLRNRGGVGHGERLTLHILDFQEGAPMRPDGNPWLVMFTTLSISKT